MRSKSVEVRKLHVRVCHVCNHTNEAEEQVDRCQHCGKVYPPFFYFSDEHAPVFSDNELRPPMIEGEMAPLRGLTVVWKAA
jgi:hypothetical protein